MKCKQCELRIKKVRTYRWLVSAKAVIGNELLVDNDRIWTVSHIWHYEEDSKYVCRVLN